MRIEQEFHLLSHRRVFVARLLDIRAPRISRQRHGGLEYFAHARPVVGNLRHCLAAVVNDLSVSARFDPTCQPSRIRDLIPGDSR